LSRVKDLVSRERAVTLEILVHLIEVERRRLHLGLGYSSMFEYAVRHLGYSESAAARRIRAARCIRDYPEIYRLLEKNEVTLITISMVAPILDEANARDLLAKIRGKSQREVEAIMATYRPPVSMRDQARPVRVAVPASSAAPTQRTSGSVGASADSAAADSVGGPPQAVSMTHALLQATTQPPDTHPASASVLLEDKFLVKFLASKTFMKKIERARALLSNTNGNPSYEFVLEAALDEFLNDHDPEERSKRREERKQKAEAKTESGEREARSVVDPPPSREPSKRGEPRRIPAAVRDAVYARDKGRCTYVGSKGERCGATHHLQIDHVTPYARGGTNALGNLRLLCERHNKLEAERVLGANIVPRARRGK
jgi:5-methylcytosine-specific restriction endonuclease McrA